MGAMKNIAILRMFDPAMIRENRAAEREVCRRVLPQVEASVDDNQGWLWGDDEPIDSKSSLESV